MVLLYKKIQKTHHIQFNKPYYWLAGDFLKMDAEEGTDLYWLEKGYASIVPTKYDLTAFEMIDELNNWKL